MLTAEPRRVENFDLAFLFGRFSRDFTTQGQFFFSDFWFPEFGVESTKLLGTGPWSEGPIIVSASLSSWLLRGTYTPDVFYEPNPDYLHVLFFFSS